MRKNAYINLLLFCDFYGARTYINRLLFHTCEIIVGGKNLNEGEIRVATYPSIHMLYFFRYLSLWLGSEESKTLNNYAWSETLRFCEKLLCLRWQKNTRTHVVNLLWDDREVILKWKKTKTEKREIYANRKRTKTPTFKPKININCILTCKHHININSRYI